LSTIIGWFFILLLCAPLIYYVLSIWRPLVVSADGTRFGGTRFLWKLSHVTGTVVDTRASTETYGTGNVYGSAYSGSVTGSMRIVTNYHESIRLRTLAGEKTVQIVNYNVSAQAGDCLSIWTAHGLFGKRVTVAVLNHTTNEQFTNDVHIYEILQPSQMVFVLYVCLAVLPLVFVGVFVDGMAFVVFFGLLIAYVIGVKRISSQFNQDGIKPIWDVSRAEARALTPA
jgi:hypothetical protein